MKSKLFFVLVIVSQFCQAQIELEHSYDDELVTRVNLEFSGDKYYFFRRATNDLILFNGDHTIWKTIPILAPPPTSFTSTNLIHISEAKFNNDSNLEIVYSYYDSTQLTFITKVYSEDGAVLATLDDSLSIVFSEIEGLADKLIAVSNDLARSKVYSLPDLSLEHSYSGGTISRVKLDVSGEKYCLLDKNAGVERIYNSDHTVWKTIALSAPAGAIYLNAVMISETAINVDELIEIGYNYYTSAATGPNYHGNIVNENNHVLLSVPNATSFQINDLDGLEKKMMVTVRTPSPRSHSDVYQIPGLVLEHSYPSVVNRTVLENSGEKYYSVSDLSTSVINIYNSDHTIWKTIPIDLENDFSSYQIFVDFITESKVSIDPLLEVGYSSWYYSPLMFTEFHSRILNENGLTYLDLPFAQHLILSEFTSLPRKVIGIINIPDAFEDTPNFSTKIYSLDPFMNTNDFENETTILAPNPASTCVSINSQSPIFEVEIYDIRGIPVQQVSGENIIKVHLERLSSGIYFLHLKNVEGVISVQKIVVSQ